MNEQTTLHQITKKIEARLIGACDNAALEAEILLAHALRKSRTYLRTYAEQPIDSVTLVQLDALVKRRINGEPIAYITGHREFWSLDLVTNKDTLIPRPETETLVELALQKIPCEKSLHVADLGTGSGAIALAIASERPNCTLIATDVSEQALTIARKNATRLALTNIEFRQGNWFRPVNNEIFDIIVSNPPYIANNDTHLQKGDLRFEPLSALQSGHDGLNAIRHIIQNAKPYLLDGGWVLVEHGYHQRDQLIVLIKNNGYRNIAWHNDTQNQPRVILGQK